MSTDAVGGKFPLIFEEVDGDFEALVHMPTMPEPNHLIQFSEQGPLYIITGATWTPYDSEAIAHVRMLSLDDE